MRGQPEVEVPQENDVPGTAPASISVLTLVAILLASLPFPAFGASGGDPVPKRPGLEVPFGMAALSSLSVVDRVENEREDLSRVATEIELHYGLVKSHSLDEELAGIVRSLTPFLLHPAFPVQVLLVDHRKPAAFYLGGETIVLTRGLLFSGRLKNTDTVAGLVILLLSRHDIFDASGGGRKKESLQDLVLRRNRAARNAAMVLVRAGYHFEGAVEAVRVLDDLRSGPDWSATVSMLNREKGRILSESAELRDGISLLLAGRSVFSVPFLVRYLESDPSSLEGRFWLGLAYYRDFYATLHPSRETLLFSVDPLPDPGSWRDGAVSPKWELEFARRIWVGILMDDPSFSPAWNGLGRMALMDGNLKRSVRFFGRAARLNPDSPWYSADFALALWMRDHKVLGLRRWNDAVSLAGYDPKLIYDQGILARMGAKLLPTGFSSLRDLPGWEFVHALWGENVGERRIRPLPSFIGQVLSVPLLPGMPLSKVRHIVGLPTTPPIHSHRYLIWDYRYREYRLAFHGGTIRIAEFFGKNREKLPVYPSRRLSEGTGKGSEDDPVEVLPYARVAYLKYRTIHHIWVVQRVGSTLDRFIILPDREDHPGISREDASSGGEKPRSLPGQGNPSRK